MFQKTERGLSNVWLSCRPGEPLIVKNAVPEALCWAAWAFLVEEDDMCCLFNKRTCVIVRQKTCFLAQQEDMCSC